MSRISEIFKMNESSINSLRFTAELFGIKDRHGSIDSSIVLDLSLVSLIEAISLLASKRQKSNRVYRSANMPENHLVHLFSFENKYQINQKQKAEEAVLLFANRIQHETYHEKVDTYFIELLQEFNVVLETALQCANVALSTEDFNVVEALKRRDLLQEKLKLLNLLVKLPTNDVQSSNYISSKCSHEKLHMNLMKFDAEQRQDVERGRTQSISITPVTAYVGEGKTVEQSLTIKRRIEAIVDEIDTITKNLDVFNRQTVKISVPLYVLWFLMKGGVNLPSKESLVEMLCEEDKSFYDDYERVLDSKLSPELLPDLLSVMF